MPLKKNIALTGVFPDVNLFFLIFVFIIYFYCAAADITQHIQTKTDGADICME